MMVLYLCDTCGRWQDVSLATSIVNAWNNAWGKLKVPPPEEEGVACPAGCGLMRSVQLDDRLMRREDVPHAPETPEPPTACRLVH